MITKSFDRKTMEYLKIHLRLRNMYNCKRIRLCIYSLDVYHGSFNIASSVNAKLNKSK